MVLLAATTGTVSMGKVNHHAEIKATELMRRAFFWAVTSWFTITLITSASACPLCQSDLGRQVRQGIFDDRFGFNVIATLLPFPILLSLAAVIYLGRCSIGRVRAGGRKDQAYDPAPPSPGEEATPWMKRGITGR